MKEEDIENIVVMILDAGGTNFEFSAMRGFEVIEDSSIVMPAPTQGSTDCAVTAIIEGFESVRKAVEDSGFVASAISFAFPGPADYANGVIGELENLPAFRDGGIPLGAYLEEHFKMPVYISNDGDLFTYGESLQPFGILTKANLLAEKSGSGKRYYNLFGVTFGTGFGGGVVINGELLRGYNGAAGEINRMRNCMYPEYGVEYSVTSHGIQRAYGDSSLSSEDIYKVAIGKMNGDTMAANKAFKELAIVAADAIANAITLLDCVVMIGGGVAKAYPLFLGKIVECLNNTFKDMAGERYPRLEVKVYNLEIREEFFEFLAPSSEIIMVNGREIEYNRIKKVGIGVSKVIDKDKNVCQNTSLVIGMGAYAFAVDRLLNID